MYGPTLSTEIVTTIFLRFEELLRKAGKMDMFETLEYNYRLKENLPFQCLQHFASILNDLIRQLTELSVALEAGTHMSQSLHKTDYECGPDCEAVVNRFCLMQSLLENNDLGDFNMNCSETEICEPADGDDATVDLIGETVAILGESDILLSGKHPGVAAPKDDKLVYNGNEILLSMPNSDSAGNIPYNVNGKVLLQLNTNGCNDLPVGIQSMECNQRFLSERTLTPEQNEGISSEVPNNSSNFRGESSNYSHSQFDSVIESDETFIAVADEVLKTRQENLARNLNSKREVSESGDTQLKHKVNNISMQPPKPVQCKQCGKTFLTEKGLKSHEGLTHKRSPEALAKQRKEEELILQKIGVLTGVTSPNINQSASFQEITAAATNNLNRSITNSQKRALASSLIKMDTSKPKQQCKPTGIEASNSKAPDLVQCHQCGKTFMTEKGLKSHEGLVHKKVAENGKLQNEVPQMPSRCKTCGKTFMTEKGLKSHEGLVHKKVQVKSKPPSSKNSPAISLPVSPKIVTSIASTTNKADSGESCFEMKKLDSKCNLDAIKFEKECIVDPQSVFESLADDESINLKIPKSHNSQSSKKVLVEILKLHQTQSEKKHIDIAKSYRSKSQQEKSEMRQKDVQNHINNVSSAKELNLSLKQENSKLQNEKKVIPARPVRSVVATQELRKAERARICKDVIKDSNKFISVPNKSRYSSGQEKSESETSSDVTSDDTADALSWIVCEKCVLVFKTLEDFQKHNCAFLGDKFDLPDSYSMAYIHDKAKLDSLHKFVCSICSEEFRSYQRICYHMKKCEVGPYFCEVCPAATPPFDSMKLLNSHKRSQHREQNSYICNECGHAFKYKNSLNKHKVQVHELNGSPDIFKCEICNEDFSKKVVLTNHKIQMHGQQRTFLCQICGSKFSSFASLTSHHAVTHDSYKKFQCNFCDKRFPRKDKLLHHESTHTGEKPFCCDICGKRFVRKIRLDDHRRRHTNDRRFPCAEPGCSKLFASQPDLNNHMKRHTAEKEKHKLRQIEKETETVLESAIKKCKAIAMEEPVKVDTPLQVKFSKNGSTIPNNFPHSQNSNESVEDVSQTDLNLASDVIEAEQEICKSENEEYRMNLEESTTTSENFEDRAASLPEQDQELFQLEYSSDIYGSNNPNQQLTQSSPNQYDTTETDGNNLMDISELDPQLYASQMDIRMSLDEDAKTLDNNLNELSDMIAQEMCHPNSFDTTLC